MGSNVNLPIGSGSDEVVSVFGRTGAVVGEETDYALFGQITRVTKTLFVDANRADTYIPDGSMARPYKTIGAAITVATIGTLINVQAGTYAENVTLPEGVSIDNHNDTKVTIEGNFETTASQAITIRGIWIAEGYTMTLNAPASISDCYCSGSAIINNIMIRGFNVNFVNLAGVTPVTINGASGHLQLLLSTIGAVGDVPTIIQNNGKTCLSSVNVTGSRAAGAVISSLGGFFIIYNSKIINSGGGAAADLQNGATAATPNILGNVWATGNIVCGSHQTIIEGLQFLTSGALSGSALLFPSSSLLKNDSTVTGATVTAALDALKILDASRALDNEVVHLAGTETVTGDKRFSGATKMGGATDNTSFEADGTMVFNGAATVFDDLPPIPLLSQRVGGANNPTLTVFKGNIQLLTFAINDYVYFNYEILHGYREGSNLSAHIHWATQGTDITDRYVKWEVEFTIANAKIVAPFDSLFPTETIVTAETIIPANTGSIAHIIASFGSVAGIGLKIGAYICGRIRRIAASSTAPTSNPFGITLGFHYEQDTGGSRQLYTK